MSIYLENQVHERIFGGVEASQQMERIVQAGGGGVLLRGIYSHGDTMFNTVQLGLLNAELDELLRIVPELSSDISSIKILSERLIKSRGYLWISGD
jgi:hypothetical protein